MTTSDNTCDNNPLVSVVIPCYNSEKVIRETIESVLVQTERNFEVIIVDDGSTDDTAAIAASSGDPRIHILRQSNSGASAARNTGIRAARGSFIAFLDSDDIWFPDFLARTLALLAASPQSVMAVTNQYWQRIPGDLSTTLQGCTGFDVSRTEIAFADLIRRNHISTSACVLRREIITECGLFDTRLAVAEDYNLWLKIAATHRKIHVITEPLGISRRYVGGSLTKDRLGMARYKLMCLDMFRASHGHLLTRSELAAFRKMRRNTWANLMYRTLRYKINFK